MDLTETIVISVTCGIIGVFVIAGISVACLRYRATRVAAVQATDLETPVPKTKMPVVASCEDLTYIRCA